MELSWGCYKQENLKSGARYCCITNYTAEIPWEACEWVSRIKSGIDYTVSLSPTIYGCTQLSLATLLSSRSRAIAFPILWGCRRIESFSNCQGRGFGLWIVITILRMFM